MMAGEPSTRRQLIDGAIETVRSRGIAGTSVHSVACTTGIDVAVITDHFTSLHELLADASMVVTRERVAVLRERFTGVTSLRTLVVVGRDLWAEERERGNLIVLSQMLAGAHTDPALVAGTGSALQLLIDEVDQMIRGVLAGSPLMDLVDPAAAARAVCASLVGLSLFGTVDGSAAGPGSTSPFDILERIANLAEDLGPFERRLLTARVRSHLDRRR